MTGKPNEATHPSLLIKRLMTPDFHDKSSAQLIDLFISVCKQFMESVQRGAGINEIEGLQFEIAAIRKEIKKKQL